MSLSRSDLYIKQKRLLGGIYFFTPNGHYQLSQQILIFFVQNPKVLPYYYNHYLGPISTYLPTMQNVGIQHKSTYLLTQPPFGESMLAYLA